VEAKQQTHSAPAAKQQLTAVRMLFDWLITGEVVGVKRLQLPLDEHNKPNDRESAKIVNQDV